MKTNAINVVLIAVLFTACASSNSNDDVEGRIREDLVNGVTANTLSIDIKDDDLPKNKFVVDKAHSSISFKTGHWEIVDLIGWFLDYEVEMYSDAEDFTDARIFAKVDPMSVVMPESRMAESVHEDPYIDAARYPYVTFESKIMEKLADNHYRLNGDFTLNGITKNMDFNVTYKGFAYPGEKSICGFIVEGSINRNDFNIGGDDKLHSGKLVHDEVIHLTMSLRME